MAVSEAWRDVPGYGGKYQASDMGRIANTFWRGQRRQNGGRTIMAQFKKKPHGNARESAKRFVHLTDLEGHRKEISAAKVVAETFLGPVPPGMAIFHKNGNYYAWDNTVGVRKAKEDLRALARQEGRLFAPKNWPAT